MKTKIGRILAGLASLITTGITAQAQYTYTTLDDPRAANYTHPSGIEGSKIVGFFYDAGNNLHGFCYSSNTWTVLDDPLAGTDLIPTKALWAVAFQARTLLGPILTVAAMRMVSFTTAASGRMWTIH